MKININSEASGLKKFGVLVGALLLISAIVCGVAALGGLMVMVIANFAATNLFAAGIILPIGWWHSTLLFLGVSVTVALMRSIHSTN